MWLFALPLLWLRTPLHLFPLLRARVWVLQCSCFLTMPEPRVNPNEHHSRAYRGARRHRNIAACLQAYLFTRTYERREHSERSRWDCAQPVIACCLTDFTSATSMAHRHAAVGHEMESNQADRQQKAAKKQVVDWEASMKIDKERPLRGRWTFSTTNNAGKKHWSPKINEQLKLVQI